MSSSTGQKSFVEALLIMFCSQAKFLPVWKFKSVSIDFLQKLCLMRVYINAIPPRVFQDMTLPLLDGYEKVLELLIEMLST